LPETEMPTILLTIYLTITIGAQLDLMDFETHYANNISFIGQEDSSLCPYVDLKN
jgi:hypothetical protein